MRKQSMRKMTIDEFIEILARKVKKSGYKWTVSPLGYIRLSNLGSYSCPLAFVFKSRRGNDNDCYLFKHYVDLASKSGMVIGDIKSIICAADNACMTGHDFLLRFRLLRAVGL